MADLDTKDNGRLTPSEQFNWLQIPVNIQNLTLLCTQTLNSDVIVTLTADLDTKENGRLTPTEQYEEDFLITKQNRCKFGNISTTSSFQIISF